MDTFNANRVLHYMAKGQLISKCLWCHGFDLKTNEFLA
jgi:hypothetical protein